MHKKNKICPIIKLFAVKSVCRVFIFNMFTCVYKLKRPPIYVVLVMTFPGKGNDCSKHWNLKFKLRSYQASWNKTASDIRWKAKKKTVNSSQEQNYCSVVLRLKSGKLLNLKAAQLTFYRNEGKTIPLKLSTVRPKNSSCSYLLGTGTLVFRFAFQFYTVVGMYSHDAVQTSVCLHHL